MLAQRSRRERPDPATPGMTLTCSALRAAQRVTHCGPAGVVYMHGRHARACDGSLAGAGPSSTASNGPPQTEGSATVAFLTTLGTRS
jgi:hypothetical protein